MSHPTDLPRHHQRLGKAITRDTSTPFRTTRRRSCHLSRCRGAVGSFALGEDAKSPDSGRVCGSCEFRGWNDRPTSEACPKPLAYCSPEEQSLPCTSLKVSQSSPSLLFCILCFFIQIEEHLNNRTCELGFGNMKLVSACQRCESTHHSNSDSSAASLPAGFDLIKEYF